MRYIVPIVIALLVVVGLAGCGPSPESLQATVAAGVTGTQTAGTATAAADVCSQVKLAAYADAAEQLLDRYQSQADVTASTPRASLGGPLQRLLDYEDEARALDAPACLVDFNAAILVMMGRFRQGYQTFAAQGSQGTIDAALTAGRQLMADLRGALPSIQGGTLPGPISIPQ